MTALRLFDHGCVVEAAQRDNSDVPIKSKYSHHSSGRITYFLPLGGSGVWVVGVGMDVLNVAAISEAHSATCFPSLHVNTETEFLKIFTLEGVFAKAPF